MNSHAYSEVQLVEHPAIEATRKTFPAGIQVMDWIVSLRNELTIDTG